MAGTNLRASMIDGAAFYDQDTESLAAYVAVGGITRYKLALIDGAGDKAVGYILDQGLGETLGGEEVENWEFTNWAATDPVDWSVTSEGGGRSINEDPPGHARIINDGTGSLYMSQNNVVTLDCLYKHIMDVTAATGSIFVWESDSPVESWKSINSAALHTWYFASDGGIGQLHIGALFGTCDITINSFSTKQVLTPSTNGVTIVSTVNGVTENWASVDGSFDPNDISSIEIQDLVAPRAMFKYLHI